MRRVSIGGVFDTSGLAYSNVARLAGDLSPYRDLRLAAEKKARGEPPHLAM